MTYISLAQANIIAQEKVSKYGDFIVIPEYTEEYVFGWVIYGIKKEYLKKYLVSNLIDDIEPAPFGTIRVIVNIDGTSSYMTSSVDYDTAIRVYTEAWSLKHP
jgi:hypothetical protein